MTTTKPIVQPTRKGKLVSTQHVNELVSNYKKERWLDNSKKIKKVDSLSTWFGLNELQDFLNIAREHNADGIKMYYGVYPEDYNIHDFRGRQTVVLVATKTKQTDNGTVNKNIYFRVGDRSEILAFNAGGICPPWCGTGLPPDGDGVFGIDMEKIGLSIINNGENIEII
jgi:hypothetical protein